MSEKERLGYIWNKSIKCLHCGNELKQGDKIVMVVTTAPYKLNEIQFRMELWFQHLKCPKKAKTQ